MRRRKAGVKRGRQDRGQKSPVHARYLCVVHTRDFANTGDQCQPIRCSHAPRKNICTRNGDPCHFFSG